MDRTPRLSLPFIAVGQAQKEFTHNESLQTLDALVGGAVEEPPRATPPGSPSLGACYIVAAGATDAWAGKSQCVAAWTSGGWRFVPPVEGLCLYERSSGASIAYRNSAWETGILRGASLVIDGQQVAGPRGAPIASPSGGTIIDNESRAAISAMLDALRQHGLIDV
jgi:hypothetical protein